MICVTKPLIKLCEIIAKIETKLTCNYAKNAIWVHANVMDERMRWELEVLHNISSNIWMINLQHNNTQECGYFDKGRALSFKDVWIVEIKIKWWMIKGGVWKWDWSMCTHKSTNKQRVDFAYETKRIFSFNLQNRNNALWVHIEWVRRMGSFI